MHLRVRHYVPFSHKNENEISQFVKNMNPGGLGDLELISLDFELGYWRRADQIHCWFVKNIQQGKDDCNEYRVDLDELMTLKNLCEQVIVNPDLASKLLPTRSGLFYNLCDEYCLETLEKTINIINRASKIASHDNEIYYKSSW